MHALWVDGPDSTWQHLQNAGLDEARDRAQNVVDDLRRRVSPERRYSSVGMSASSIRSTSA
jgi:hypothetical protein